MSTLKSFSDPKLHSSSSLDYAIDPILRDVHQLGAAGPIQGESALGNGHMLLLNTTPGPHEIDSAQRELISPQYRLDHRVGVEYSSTNQVNSPTSLLHARSPSPSMTVSGPSTYDVPNFNPYPSINSFGTPDPDATNTHHAIEHQNSALTLLASDGADESQKQVIGERLLLEGFDMLNKYPTPDKIEKVAQIAGRSVSYVINWLNDWCTKNKEELLSSPTIAESGAPAAELQPGRQGKRPQTIVPFPPGTSHNLYIMHARSPRPELWPCTFCFKPIKRKGWTRHMNSHVAPSWICMPKGTPLVDYTCVFCGLEGKQGNVACEHPKVDSCCDKAHANRAYPSVEKLRQHIRIVHLGLGGKTRGHVPINIPKSWYIPRHVDSALWCGFCQTTRPNWQETTKHIITHFKDRRGFGPWITWGPTTS